MNPTLRRAAEKLRTIDHVLPRNAFIFAALWFIIGAIMLWSPIPGELGIGAELFAVWLVLFFLALAAAGSLLTIASLNTLFPRPGAAAPSVGERASRFAPSRLRQPQAAAGPHAPQQPQRDG